MGLVQAICPYCNNAIKADTDRDAAICPFCLEPYVVEMAIRKYGQVNGTIENDAVMRKNPMKDEAKMRKNPMQDDAVARKSQVRDDGLAHKSPVVEASEAEKALAQRVVQAVKKVENHDVTGLFTSEGMFGSERELREEIKEKLEVSLFSPDPMGNGLIAIMQEYKAKYAIYDVVSEDMNGNALAAEIERLLKEDGIAVHEVAVKTITLNRCEWYETKGLFGLKLEREKRIVSKAVRGIFVSCG